MTTVSVHEAKTHLSRLLQRVEAGEEVIIARGGQPVAKLSAIAEKLPKQPGQLRGAIAIADAFDDPLPADFLSREP